MVWRGARCVRRGSRDGRGVHAPTRAADVRRMTRRWTARRRCSPLAPRERTAAMAGTMPRGYCRRTACAANGGARDARRAAGKPRGREANDRPRASLARFQRIPRDPGAVAGTYASLEELEAALIAADLQQLHGAALVRRETGNLADELANESSALGQLALWREEKGVAAAHSSASIRNEPPEAMGRERSRAGEPQRGWAASRPIECGRAMARRGSQRQGIPWS